METFLFIVCLLEWFDSQAKRATRGKHQEVYRWQIFSLSFAKVLDSHKIKKKPSVKLSKFTGGKFFFIVCIKCWTLKLKEHPMCKRQHVYRWQFLLFIVCQLWILTLKVHPHIKTRTFTGGKFCVYVCTSVGVSSSKITQV